MKKVNIFLIFILFLYGCSQVEEIKPLLYPSGRIPPPENGMISYAELPPPQIHNPVPYWISMPKDEMKKIISKEIGNLANLSEENTYDLAHEGLCIVENKELEDCRSLEEGYDYLNSIGLPLILTTDWIVNHYYTLFRSLYFCIESRFIKPYMQKMLQSMIHTSLEQYYISGGDVKEAAWRNTAFLCVASRILNPNAPTPFIVSGIVRKELDLIKAANGEAPSPLFSLDSKINPCISPKHEGCVDYSIFKTHSFVRLYNRHSILHKALLWLSFKPLDLSKKYQFIQAVLLSDCAKRAQCTISGKEVSAWQIWYSVTRFYSYSHKTVQNINLHDMDNFIDQTFPKGFDENITFESSTFKKFQKTHPMVSIFRNKFKGGLFRFLPLWIGPFKEIFSKLVFPEVGPDINNPLYTDYLLKELSPGCAPGKRYTFKMGHYLNCNKLTKEDLLFLLCNAKTLSFKNKDVMSVFRFLPTASDLLTVYGWDNSKLYLSFCGLDDNINKIKSDIARISARNFEKNFVDAICYTIQQLNPAVLGKSFIIPLRSRRFRYSAYGMLCQIQNNDYGLLGATASTNFPKSKNMFLESSVFFYNRLKNLTDFLRRNLMNMGFSDLKLDDIILEYIDMADHLSKISADSFTLPGLTPEERRYIDQLPNRFSFMEEKLMKYIEPQMKSLPLLSYPHFITLMANKENHQRLIGISGNFHLLLVSAADAEGTKIYAAPLPLYYEMITSTEHLMKSSYILYLLKKGVPKKVD